MTVRVAVEHPARVPFMDASDIHCGLDQPPHMWCDLTCRALWIAAVRKLADDALAVLQARQRLAVLEFHRQFESEQFGRAPIEKLRMRRSMLAVVFGLEPVGLDADAIDCHLRALNDPARCAWLDKICGTRHWREAGVGIARADCRADGFWRFWADADVLGPKSGTAVLTVPAFDGDAVVEIFAIEIAPAATQRRTGRVFRLTGLCPGLGIDTFEALEWRHSSKRLALVVSPLDWVRSFARAAETGCIVPLLDGQPCTWLAGLDEAQGIELEEFDRQAIDDLLCAADPILIDGADPDFAFCVQAALDRARRRRMPPKPELLVWTPDTHSNKEEHAA